LTSASTHSSPRQPVRIVAVADTHTFQDDLGEIPDGDVFIHAGDMCRGGTLEELAPVAEWIRALPHSVKIVVAGNHDWSFVRERQRSLELLGDDVHYLQDSGIEAMGLSFWGSPWQPAFNDWAFNLPRGPRLAERWALIPGSTDILITHGPPAGFGDRSWDSRAGCEDLLTALERVQPLLHVFGHIHQDGGAWREGPATVISNVTTWECERSPSVFDIDPEAKTVETVSIPPAKGRGQHSAAGKDSGESR
jgi:Icc-related predicted phosphoesterase